MNEDMQSAMTEATHLTAAGRLAEATAMIQRRLGGFESPAARAAGRRSDEKQPQAFQPATASPRPERIAGEFREQDAGETNFRKLLRHAAMGVGSAHLQRCRTGTAPFPPDLESAAAEAGGLFVAASYSNAAGTRGYRLYVPSGYNGQAVPLIVMLHGGTQTALDFAAGTRMNEFAERGTFLVAYPEQASSANASRCWNWFQTGNQHRDAGEPSLIAGITRKIMTDFQVDPKRVYVAGFSAGGAMATIMASTYPDLYAAVGVHSGLTYRAAHDLPSAFAAMKQGTPRGIGQAGDVLPLIVFHGDGDHIVDRANADCIRDDWGRAANRKQTSLGGGRPEPVVTRGQVAEGRDYTRFSFRDDLDRPSFELWIVHEAGHAWAGGSPAGSYTDPRGPDASAEMVRFFKEHPKETPAPN